MRRFAVAALAAVAVWAAGAWALGAFVDANRCGPGEWWPDWAWPCRDRATRAARDLTRMDWDRALPVMAGLAAFVTVALTGARRR